MILLCWDWPVPYPTLKKEKSVNEMLRYLINTFQLGEKTEELSGWLGEDPSKSSFILNSLHFTRMSAKVGARSQGLSFPLSQFGKKTSVLGNLQDLRRKGRATFPLVSFLHLLIPLHTSRLRKKRRPIGIPSNSKRVLNSKNTEAPGKLEIL